jgi:hypothetical protein
MIFREIAQDRGIDRVLAENRLVLTQAEAQQPASDIYSPIYMIVQAIRRVQGGSQVD